MDDSGQPDGNATRTESIDGNSVDGTGTSRADLDMSTATAFLGGAPTVHNDLGATIVFLVLFLVGVGANLAIFIRDRKRGLLFLLSIPTLGFCIVRVLTCVFRIAWMYKPDKTVVMFAVIFQNFGYATVHSPSSSCPRANITPVPSFSSG